MSSAGVVEPVDVLKYSNFCLPPRWPFLPPHEFSLQRFEECFDGCIVVAIALTTHGRPQTVCQQLLLVIVGAILASAI